MDDLSPEGQAELEDELADFVVSTIDGILNVYPYDISIRCIDNCSGSRPFFEITMTIGQEPWMEA